MKLVSRSIVSINTVSSPVFSTFKFNQYLEMPINHHAEWRWDFLSFMIDVVVCEIFPHLSRSCEMVGPLCI